MTRMKSVSSFSGVLLIVFNGMFYNCFSQSVPQKSVKLEYNLPSAGVKYLNTNKIIQTMDIMGQVMEANVFSAFGCSISQTGKQDGNLNLEVKVDTMGQRTESPNGSVGGAITEVIGKTFSITISPSGKEKDISQAEKITFNVEGSGPSDLSQSFYDYFPDLPVISISPGYTWTTTDTMNAKTPSMTMMMIITSENRFEDFETVDGIECVKITSTLSGTRDMKIRTQENDIKLAGPFTGSGTLFFSPADGYFIKQLVTTNLKGTIDITYPEAISFPLVQDMNMVNQVVK
jgi:hypothetical protein